MGDTPPHDTGANGYQAAQDEPAEQLWQLWRHGQRPDVEAFLTRAGALGLAQKASVLRVDQRERWQAGDRVAAEAYLQRHGDIRADPDTALDLIFNEFLVRERLGEKPVKQEFLHRFPEHAVVLESQFDLHLAMAEEAAVATALPEGWELDSSAAPVQCPAAPATPSGPALPESFGRYRIIQVIGQGSMGTVYEAHDTQIDRRVALKVPHFGGDAKAIERFYREARIAGTFTHPHLCPVYDVGQMNGTHYLTMPLLSGEPLAAWLRREGPLPEATAVRLTALVARALQVAHAAGVIHRDLKPANILLVCAGADSGESFGSVARHSPLTTCQPRIIDFGLARRDGPRDARMTASGVLVGTPAYLPPEQLDGDSKAMGPRCDVYSLGVILYEMLAGQLPFQGSIHEVLRQVLTKDPEPPSRHRPDLDPRLEAICLMALAKDPKDRFPSMQAFADALENYKVPGSAATVVDARIELEKSPRRMSGRRTWLVAACCSLLGLGAAIWLATLFLTGPAPTVRGGDALQAGSLWEGTFRFPPPHDRLHDVKVTITERSGARFAGEYVTEGGAFQWAIEGTVENEDIQWRFTRVIRERVPSGVVESASVKGKITGETMTVRFKDADSGVTMELRRRK